MQGVLPGMYFVGLQDTQKRWLLIMRVVNVTIIGNTMTFFLHLGTCYLFVFVFDWGLLGLGWAFFTSSGLMLLAMIIMTNYVPEIQ